MSKHSKQSKKQSYKAKPDNIKLTKDVGEVLTKLAKPDNPIVEKRIIKSNEETKTVNEDPQGNLVLTPEDKDRIEKVKALQAKAKQAKIDAREALAKAQEAIEALSGSEAIKAIKQDIETRLVSQEDIVTKALTIYQTEKDKLQSIQSEYQALTGIDKKVKASKSKSKSKSGNGNGKFETKINQDDNTILILVTHKASQNLFEYSLYPSNGKIAKDDWLKLRHGLTAQFEKETKEDNLTIRAYLSNLKSKIEAIKAIA